MVTPFRQLAPPPARGGFNPSLYSDPDWFAEEKLDGDRRICQLVNGKARFTGRRISDVDGLFVEKTECLPQFHSYPESLEGTVLDGEIVSPVPGARSKDVTSIMGSKPEKAIAKQKERGWLNYIVFDCLWFKGRDIRHLALRVRRQYLQLAGEEWTRHRMAGIHRQGVIDIPRNAFTDKESFLVRIWAQGGEGIILKHLSAEYGDENSWVKVKRELTQDVVVMGYDDPEAMTEKTESYVDESGIRRKRVLEISESRLKANGWIGAIRFGQYRKLGPVDPGAQITNFDHAVGVPNYITKDGHNYELTYCGSCSGMDDVERAKISNDKPGYLGKVLEILANEREPTGKFRHPRMIQFRDNKNPTDCLWGV